MMKIPAALTVAGLLGACGWLPLASLGEPRVVAAPKSAPAPIALQRSLDLRKPPATPPPMQAETTRGDTEFQTVQTRALAGDKDAAYRVALMFRDGSNGLPRDPERMLRWLHHASELDNANASYQLYLYYLNRGLDRHALRYESRALRQGFVPPPRVDPRRG